MKFLEWLSAPGDTPYLVAEIGGNHGGRLDRAIQLIQLAAVAGVDAVKLQAYKADRLVSATAPIYFSQRGKAARSQREFFRQVDQFGESEYRACAAAAREAQVDFLCTPFDEQAVLMLAPLVPAWKIASADLTHWPLVECAAATGKPLLLSTGAATWEEIERTYRHVAWDHQNTVLLHCVLSYPTAPGEAELATLLELRHRFPQARLGYSDHTVATPNMDVCGLAYALGARLIEKHFTDDHRQLGQDHYHSMEPRDVRHLRVRLDTVRRILGSGDRTVAFPAEAAARLHARRSWHAARALPAGHALAPGDLIAKRPGTGLAPIFQPWGAHLLRSLAVDEIVTADAVSFALVS